MMNDTLDAINELLNVTDNHASDDGERDSIISLCSSHIIENIQRMAATTEDGIAMIEKITAELKAVWKEVREDA
ncbi:hypothetical protein [Bradyrhizobium elkanii]|uniref:hypothetical protein n=1 Tax=Bradyrhizobium elkanii TaxID=29448 RepID=UPI00040C707F|nr:hypothetical protein [Bradyrhizobium elkanii]